MTPDRAPAAPVELPDGSVIVPARLAGAVRRILVRDLAQHIRQDGGGPSAAVRELLYVLGRAEHRTDQIAQMFDSETSTSASPTLEISTAEAAALLECSSQYVRALVRSGHIVGRRIGQRAWLIDRASLDAYRYRTDDSWADQPSPKP